MASHGTTTLKDYGRRVRNEPLNLVYKHRVWVEKDQVPAEEVLSWLRKLYVEARTGRLYRLTYYLHLDGNRYVDQIQMQKCTDSDLMYIKMRWGFSEHKVQRGERQPRRKLTVQQKRELDHLIAETRQRFYDEQDMAR